MSVSFNGATRVEVISVLANCGRDTDKARRALVTWIRHKQDKGRGTEHILVKLRDVESKFIKDTSLHCAFRDARAETCLPRAPDLPLPASVKRRSDERTPESMPTPKSTGRASISSSLNELPATSTTSPPVSPLHFSRDSSQMSEALPGNSNTSGRTSYPQSISRVSQPRSPRIQIPRDRSLRPDPSSPTTSSPEEPDHHFNRYSHMSQPLGSSSGLLTPVSASHLEYPMSQISRDQNLDSRRRLSYSLVSLPPSARITIPRSRSQRSVPHSPPNYSSDESDSHLRRYRPMSHPISMSHSIGHMSPGRCRLTPPKTSPPDVPLPPIPDSESDKSKKSLPAGHPPTPMQSSMLHSYTPMRPLPIQPIPSPVPGSDESESHDAIGEDTLRQNWQGSDGDLPSDIVVRQDSPVYGFRDDHAPPTGISPPPPYVDQFDTHAPPDMPPIGVSLEKAVDKCGGTPEVRLVVSKCVEFHRGYEPPYWQSRLQACGLDAEAAKCLVDEMSKQVDWAMSFRRST
ncbi:hypothetical protein JVT61DRAFT_6875 [Boletus reticuloceps]|uniref:Uncharacterized protein n=1 Tax=Boletus reticuloceps TaxID=495285 RepID=A0A8I2YJ46_9AGAM|nr:hypothetical protein JVT61DRAFT_6875 [Boletus reticuloceps]